MLMNRKPTGRAASMPVGLACGAAASLSITLFASAMIAKMVETENLVESGVGYGIMMTLMTASFFGALISAGRKYNNGKLTCVLSCILRMHAGR